MKIQNLKKHTFILLALFCLLISIMLMSSNLENNYITFAADEQENYSVKIDLPNGTILWLGNNGFSANASTVLSKGFAMNFNEIRKSFVKKGGYQEGKIFEDFYSNGEIFGWTFDTVPDLSSFKSNDGVIHIEAKYKDEMHTIQYYVDDELYSTYTGKINTNISVKKPVRYGNKFTQWTEKNTNQVFNYSLMPDLTPNEEKNGLKQVEANWTEKLSTIAFDSMGGSQCANKTNVKFGSKLENMPTPTRTGYSFDGWYADKEYKGKKYTTGSIWDQDILGNDNPNIKLYARWLPITYMIKFNTNGGNTINSQPYTIEKEISSLPTPTRSGYVFVGWRLNGEFITSISKGNVGNKDLVAVWSITRMANTWTNTKLQDQMLVLSFRNFTSVNVNRVYYISEKVEKLTLLGIKDKTFRNIRFEIENRTTPITIELNQFQFCAQDDQNAIYAQDATSASIKKINESYCMEIAGNSVLNLNAIGKCFIGGGTRNSYVLSDGVYPNKFCSAIVCANINLHNEKQGDVLVISGGNGADGITSDEKTEGFGASQKRDGKPGGSAIWACRLNIDCYGLLISGGTGGNGAVGVTGATGARGASTGHTQGYDGGNGSEGGAGGAGRYAFNVSRSINISESSTIIAMGGNGGNGGKGGTGGTGGKGRVLGKGGNGGNGGTGGNKGLGYNVINSTPTVTGKIGISIDGKDGKPGEGGEGGAGGAGAISTVKSGNPGQKGESGT